MTSTASEIARMPHFSILRRIQIGLCAVESKFCSVRRYITCAPSEIFAVIGVPASLNSYLKMAGSLNSSPRAAAISRAIPRILNAYPRSGLTATSKMTSLISSNSMASSPGLAELAGSTMIPE